MDDLGVPLFSETSIYVHVGDFHQFVKIPPHFFAVFLKGEPFHDHGNPVYNYPILGKPCIEGCRISQETPQLLHLAGAGSLWYAPPELNPPVEVDERGRERDRFLRKLATVLRKYRC